jgi:2-amino-4-hydroxy-6-hydroxymethyldihydropteridine diphosphokinase
MVIAWIGIGTNMGDRKNNLRNALEFLLLHPNIQLHDFSSIYETEPVEMHEADYFLNMVVGIQTSLPAHEILSVCLSIENKMGRERPYPNAPRTMDLDILFFGDYICSTKELTIPHPRMTVRKFVLLPLLEVAPTLIHPQLHREITSLAESYVGREEISIWIKKTGGEISALFES